MSWRRSRRLLAALLTCLLAASAITAWATWSAAATATSHGAAAAATVNPGATPTATGAPGRTVTVSWGASTLTNGHAVDGYLVRRYVSGGALQTTLAGCSGMISATSCTEAGVPVGSWRYTVTPVIATNWRGAEGPLSGIVTVAAATLTLAKTLFGGSLPQTTTGSLGGFAANEGVTYRLDAATSLTGSPSSVSSAGTATISSLAIPSTTDGAHTVYALGNASPFASQASTGIVTDLTPPTVSSQLTPAASGAGWNNTAPVAVALSASDATSGLSRITYTTDGSDPTTSGTALVYAGPLSLSASTTVKFFATDNAGNASTVQTQLVKIDTTPPVNGLALSSVSGGALLSGSTVYYRGSVAGSFTLTNTLADTGGSGPASNGTAALAGTSTGLSHTSSLVTTPTGGPYVSNVFSWLAGTTSSPSEAVTGSDVAGNTATTTFTLIPDTTGPAGGALTVNAVIGSGAGTTSASSSGSFAIARTDYTDAGSGLSSSILTLQAGSLSSAGGIVAGTCSGFGTASVITGNPAQTVTGPACFLYTLTGSDRVGNVSSISTTVLVDTTGPSAPVLTLSGATGSSTYIGPGTTTVYINPQAGKSGGFLVGATTTDADSGIAKVNFPGLTGFTSGGGDTLSSPFQTTYAWTGTVAASGSQTVTATNGATGTATSTFTVTPDTTGPVGGLLTVNAVAASGSGSMSSSASGSFAIARTDYTGDGTGGSGLASSVLTLQTAPLSSSDGVAAGVCGTFSAGAILTGSPVQALSTTDCYRYTLTGTDRVGNMSSLSTTVEFDASAPGIPPLSIVANGSNTYAQGTAVTINAQSGKSGSFQVTASPTDGDSGILNVGFPLPTGFTSGNGSVTSSPFSTNYVWSGAVGASGSQTVTATNQTGKSSTGSFTVTSDTTSPTVTNVVSVQAAGGTAGKLEVGDSLVLTFSEDLANIPGTFSGTEDRAASGLLSLHNVFLNIPNFTIGPLDTGSSGYLSTGLLCGLVNCAAGSATFGGNAVLVDAGAATTVTLTITSVGGDSTAVGSGQLAFQPANAITDRVGNGATGTHSTANGFKLF
jgi:hypothetical protein